MNCCDSPKQDGGCCNMGNNIGRLISRIEKLESENKMRQDTIACVDQAYDEACRTMEDRLAKIEHCFGAVLDHGKKLKIGDSPKESKPHKCPVCDGLGTHEIAPDYTVSVIGSSTQSTVFKRNSSICNSCNGKGIVWG